VVQAAVVAKGDHSGGVDGVGTYAAMGGDDVAVWGGFGSAGVGLGGSGSVQGAVWSALVERFSLSGWRLEGGTCQKVI
jgi:hypothetical protein